MRRSHSPTDYDGYLRMVAGIAAALTPAADAWVEFMIGCRESDHRDGYEAFWAGPDWFAEELDSPFLNEAGRRFELDVDRISETEDWGAASPVDEDTLEACFGSTTPERETLDEGFPSLLESLGRGEARYFLVYEHGAPKGIVFLGISYD